MHYVTHAYLWLAMELLHLYPGMSSMNLTYHHPSLYELDVMARVADGEGVHLVNGHEAEATLAVTHCLINRAALEKLSIEGAAERYFHGYSDKRPPPDLYALVELAAFLHGSGERDYSHGAPHMRSWHDLVKEFGADASAAASAAVTSYMSGEYGLFFYKEYPPTLKGD